jgi:hypothetical protein
MQDHLQCVMMTETLQFTMAFRSISDDDAPEEEKEIIGAGSIAEPDLAEKKLVGDEDPLEPDTNSFEDEAEKELGDDDDEQEEM